MRRLGVVDALTGYAAVSGLLLGVAAVAGAREVSLSQRLDPQASYDQRAQSGVR